MSTIEIREHTPGKKINDFLDVTKTIFEGDPNFIPPLNIMFKDQLSPKSPFFQHAEVALFTARKNGRLVGRISAQIDREHLKRYSDDTGFFGFFDTIEDPEVAKALMDKAKEWLRHRGMKRILGPMNLSINQEIGNLVEGFDTPPMLMMPHNRPYQDALIKGCGLEKCKDLYAWQWVTAPEMPRRCMKAHTDMLDLGVIMRSADLSKEIDELLAIQDEAWKDNWGHVSMTHTEGTQLISELKMIIDPTICIVIEIGGEIVGMAIAIPNLNEAIADFGGTINPIKIAKLLWRLKVERPKTARLAFLGIRSDIRKQKKYRPLALALIAEINRRGYQRGYTMAELSWTLEDNGPVNALIKSAGGKVYKRYRIYDGSLEN